MPLSETEVLDIGPTRFTDPKAVQSEEDSQSSVAVVKSFGGEQERSQLSPVQSPPLGGMDFRPAHVLRGIGWDSTVDLGKPVEAADGGETPIDGGRGEAFLLHGGAVELDMRSLRLQYRETNVGRPLKKGPEVVSVGVERTPAVPGQEGCCCQLRLIEDGIFGDDCQWVLIGAEYRHDSPLGVGRTSQHRPTEPVI